MLKNTLQTATALLATEIAASAQDRPNTELVDAPSIADLMTIPADFAPWVYETDPVINDALRPPGTPEGYVLIDGCILIPEEDWLNRSYNPGSAWPNGIVPIEFDPALTALERYRVAEAMAALNATAANIQFIYRSVEPDYIYITYSTIDGVSSSSSIGKSPSGGEQRVSIHPTHFSRILTICHEFMHAIGYYHEQSRPDRDSHLTVHWDRIAPNFEHNFALVSGSQTLGTPYDYTSIMHYSQCAFSTCGSPGCNDNPGACRTLTTANPSMQNVIGRYTDFGDYDDDDLVAVYGTGTSIYADATHGTIGTGQIHDPFSSIELAAFYAGGNTVWMRGGSIFQVTGGILDRPARLTAHGGLTMLTRFP